MYSINDSFRSVGGQQYCASQQKTYQFFRHTVILGCQTLNFVFVLFSLLLQNFRWRMLPPHPSGDWRWGLGHFSGRRVVLLFSRGSSHDLDRLMSLCVLLFQSTTRFDATLLVNSFVCISQLRILDSFRLRFYFDILRAILGLQDTLGSASLDKMMSCLNDVWCSFLDDDRYLGEVFWRFDNARLSREASVKEMREKREQSGPGYKN